MEKEEDEEEEDGEENEDEEKEVKEEDEAAPTRNRRGLDSVEKGKKREFSWDQRRRTLVMLVKKWRRGRQRGRGRRKGI